MKKRMKSALAICLALLILMPTFSPIRAHAFCVEPKLAAGSSHTLALQNDGTVKAWGNNSLFQLGIGNKVEPISPVAVPGLSNVKEIATGASHSLALLSDGTVKAWGPNSYGALGIGNTTNPNSPVVVPGLGNVKDIVAGGYHSLALLNDGTVMAWGYNYSGQLGIGNTTNQSCPVAVPGLSNVKEIVAGDNHSFALLNDGTVMAWGYNSQGQLGIGNTTNQSGPMAVPGLSNVKKIVAGGNHSFALLNDGTVMAWGNNFAGQLGIGNTANQSCPVAVPGLSNVTEIVAGYNHSLALLNDGTVMAWGINDSGQLGIGNTTNQSSPVAVPGLSNVTEIVAGYNHSFALHNDGTVNAWGKNDFGQLGIGEISKKSKPVAVTSLTNVKEIAAGSYYSLALLNDGIVNAWGKNDSGQLGIGNMTNQSTPVAVMGLSNVKEIVAGDNHSFALLNDGTVMAWGANYSGQLGIGNTSSQSSPVAVPGLTNVKEIVAGEAHSFALLNDGMVMAWGSNYFGELGIGNTTDQHSPVAVPGLSNVNQIEVGGYHSFAILNDGTVKAWGQNDSGQLGIGNTTNQSSPVAVPELNNVKEIAARGGYSIALLNDGTVMGWGANYSGQLGIENTNGESSPVAVLGLINVKEIVSGESHSLALLNDGTVKACGGNSSGQLGIGYVVNQCYTSMEAVSGLNNVNAIVAGYEHTFAFLNDGTVMAWGNNYHGQLGLGYFGYETSPTTLTALTLSSRAPNTDHTLSDLTLSDGTLSPVFAAGTTDYTASVANSVTGITVTPTATDATASIKVNGTVVNSGSESGNIPLNVGPNTITVLVTAEDNSTQTYSITVTRAVVSSDNSLSGLSLSSGTLSPVFAAGTTDYTASVANSVTGITVTPATTDATASIKVNGVAVNSGSASGNIPLNVGSNTITVLVTAEDSSTRTYTITVMRAASSNNSLSGLSLSEGSLSPVFVAGITVYTASVANSVTGITVTPTKTDATASIKVNGVAVNSGNASENIPLSVGTNTITVLVTAEDNSTQTYKVTVTKAASNDNSLSGLTLSDGTLSPVFAKETTDYTASVANSVTGITVTPTTSDATASIKVNGTVVNSATASGNIPLSVGSNTITVLVTVEDNSTQSYKVTVTRAASSDNSLSGLSLSNGTLSPVFATGTTDYTASVANSVTGITVMPTKTDATASIKVNGVAVNSGSASGNIPLSVGTNTITVLVTAEDNSSQTYKVTVTKAASSDNSLSCLGLSAGTLSPVFAAGTTDYTASVANSVTGITVTPTATDATASIKVNGIAVNSGSASGNVPLSVGTNTITVLVTAEDSSTCTYSITVTRAASSDATLVKVLNQAITGGSEVGTSSEPKTASINIANSITAVAASDIIKHDAGATVTFYGTDSTFTTSPSSSISLKAGSGTSVYVKVIAADNTSLCYKITINRASIPSNGGSGGGGSSTSTPSQASVIVFVNGTEQKNLGTETKTTEQGKTIVTVEVNNKVIESILNEDIKNKPLGENTIQVQVADTKSQIARVNLPGDLVKKLETNKFGVSIKRDSIEYVIPAEEFNVNKVAEKLGVSESNLKDIKIEVRITQLDEKVIAKYKEVAKANGAELILPPVAFEITAKVKNTDATTSAVEISKFSNYVERVMEIPTGVDPSKITTGIVFNKDGTYSHVPTEVFQKNGKWYAKLSSLTNSEYSVLWNPVAVKSMEKHWAKDAVNNMASRLVIMNPETFDPNRAITRADFAEYIVRALGLYRADSTHGNPYKDVSATGEKSLAILIANENGIVTGYADGTFKPESLISREEAMTMYERAMKITKLVGTDENRYQAYSDFKLVGSWASTYVKDVLAAHVFNGSSATTISPKSNLTYAEAAQAIQNLLVESKLISK